jgi:predicted nucleic acid-binding protein
MSDILRVQHLKGILLRSHEYIKIDNDIVSRAKELGLLGIKNLDALHISYAERADAVFLTTDDGIINTLKHPSNNISIRIDNPVRWLEEVNKNL